MKILLVDDDDVLLSVFETTLKKEGFEVTTATDGKTGEEKARTGKPDLIFLDQVLPDTTGNEILKNLKKDQETKDIAIVMLSNFGQNELVSEAINNGALDYILKYKIEPQDLVKKVREILQETNSNSQQAN